MPRSPSSLAELRSLVAAWKPPPKWTTGCVPTGVAAIDDVLGGGLANGLLTELVATPGSGGQLVLAQLLETTRVERLRVALIDAQDTFSPDEFSAGILPHLVWARCNELSEAFTVADILVRDGNYAIVVIDLREVPVATLNRLPKTNWHRLHRIAERQTAAILVMTRYRLVPAVHHRLQLSPTLTLAKCDRTRVELLGQLNVELLRGSQAKERTG